jgi:Fe-Mn family superoxide dismutase
MLNLAMDRRTVLRQMGVLSGAALLGAEISAQILPSTPAVKASPFTLAPLPYAYDALEPYIDAETMHLHHDKHHQAYVNNLNAVVTAHPELTGRSLDSLLAHLDTVPEAARAAVRNNGGGHANHSFFWTVLGKGSSQPRGELAKAIDARFGSLGSFQEKLTTAALSVFGSGWAWLLQLPDGSLTLETTANQDAPISQGKRPVLALDVWEHAYYLKYQNRRAEYVKAYLQVVNWEAVSAQFAQKA